ncbi:MAG: hypothetical protein ACK4UN_07005 [Limisphaerales bacterium]
MRRFFKALRKPAAAEAGEEQSSENAPLRRESFQTTIGEVEKHLLEVTFLFPLTVRVDGQDVTNRFGCRLVEGVETYEGNVGEQEISSVRIERKPGILFRSANRLFVNGRLVTAFKGKRRHPTRRELVRRTVLPSLILLLCVYYSFVLNPAVITYYCGSMWNTSKPSQSVKVKPSVADTQQRI